MRFLQSLVILAALALLAGCASPRQGRVADSAPKARIEELIRRELLYESSRLWRSAIDINQEILRQDPRNTAAMNTIAGLHGTLEEPQEEVTWALKALEIDPRYERAYINEGNGLTALGRTEEARAAYEKAEALDPKDPLPVYSLGVLAENQGKIEEALAFYQQSVALDGTFENGYFNMAAMLANLKRFDEAADALHKLLKLNPAAPNAEEMLQHVEQEKESQRSRIGPWDVQRPAGVARCTLEFRLVLDKPEPGSLELPDPRGATLILSPRTVVTQSDIVKTAIIVSATPGYFAVYVYFTPEAAQRMREASGANLGGRMAILMDGHVFIALYMHAAIDSPAMIEGMYTREEAIRVAEQLAP